MLSNDRRRGSSEPCYFLFLLLTVAATSTTAPTTTATTTMKGINHELTPAEACWLVSEVRSVPIRVAAEGEPPVEEDGRLEVLIVLLV